MQKLSFNLVILDKSHGKLLQKIESGHFFFKQTKKKGDHSFLNG